MKIAFIDFVLDPAKPGASGLSDVVWNTARELAKLGDEVHVVGPYSIEPEPFPGVTVHRFTLPPIGYRNIVGHIMIALKAWREVRKIAGIDVIYAPEYLSSGIIAPLSRVPVILRTPGNIYERLATSNPYDWSATQAYKLAARSSARWCAHVIAISHDMGRWWHRTGVPVRRLTVIANGVDVQLFRRPAETPSVSDRPFTVLVVGRLSVEKNLEVVLEAVARLVRDGKPVALEIVGDGPLRQSLERRVHDLSLHDAVTFHGWLPKAELPRFYTEADVFVFPSLSEPLGRVMLEAMACGTPVVGARVGGIPDHVVDSETGFLFDPTHVEGLVERLRLLIDNPDLTRRMGEGAYRYVQNNLTWPVVARRVRSEILAATATTGRLGGTPLEQRQPEL